MSRLGATVLVEARLQWRNGFYYASAFAVVASIVALRWLQANAIDLLLPVVIFENVMLNSFYFVAGVILLEKAEGTRAVLVVTPLRRVEYIGSKVLTLAALSLVESLLISAGVQGVALPTLPLAAGIALSSALFTLFGIALVAPYSAINEFIMPSVVYTMLLSLPLLGWFGIGAAWWWLWHPLQGPLDLMSARTTPLSTGRAAYALLWPALWLAPVYLWSRRALQRSTLT